MNEKKATGSITNNFSLNEHLPAATINKIIEAILYLEDKAQDNYDENLETTAKTILGAINELNQGKMDKGGEYFSILSDDSVWFPKNVYLGGTAEYPDTSLSEMLDFVYPKVIKDDDFSGYSQGDITASKALRFATAKPTGGCFMALKAGIAEGQTTGDYVLFSAFAPGATQVSANDEGQTGFLMAPTDYVQDGKIKISFYVCGGSKTATFDVLLYPQDGNTETDAISFSSLKDADNQTHPISLAQDWQRVEVIIDLDLQTITYGDYTLIFDKAICGIGFYEKAAEAVATAASSDFCKIRNLKIKRLPQTLSQIFGGMSAALSEIIGG